MSKCIVVEARTSEGRSAKACVQLKHSTYTHISQLKEERNLVKDKDLEIEQDFPEIYVSMVGLTPRLTRKRKAMHDEFKSESTSDDTETEEGREEEASGAVARI